MLHFVLSRLSSSTANIAQISPKALLNTSTPAKLLPLVSILCPPNGWTQFISSPMPLNWLFPSLLLSVLNTKLCRWAALTSLREATDYKMLCAIRRTAVTICVSSCSLAVSGSPPVGLDAESWLSILLSSKRKSSISLWKPWAFWEKDISTVSVSKQL